MEELQTEHGIFTSNEAIGKSAQEVYNEWLLNKDKPQPKTEVEILKEQLEAERENSAQVSNTLMEFMDFFFLNNPDLN